MDSSLWSPGESSEERCLLEEAKNLPSDPLWGPGAVEIILTRLLGDP